MPTVFELHGRFPPVLDGPVALSPNHLPYVARAHAVKSSSKERNAVRELAWEPALSSCGRS